MVKIRKYANVIERFLHGEKGQRFFNFAYSIGAAIVIWGALFKILHLPGGSLLLCIGMGTEIAMFILTAFDRPPKEYAWEEVFPVLDSKNEEDRPNFAGHPEVNINGVRYAENEYDESTAGVATVSPQTVSVNPVPEIAPMEKIEMPDIKGLAEASADYVSQMSSIAEEIATLNETYTKQMRDLNRNVGGLNTIYEIQLKGISAQLETIDSVNRGLKDLRDMYEKSAHESTRYCEETEKMARYMRQLNAVYEKMITAMTINMQTPVMGGMPVNPFDKEDDVPNA